MTKHAIAWFGVMLTHFFFVHLNQRGSERASERERGRDGWKERRRRTHNFIEWSVYVKHCVRSNFCHQPNVHNWHLCANNCSFMNLWTDLHRRIIQIDESCNSIADHIRWILIAIKWFDLFHVYTHKQHLFRNLAIYSRAQKHILFLLLHIQWSQNYFYSPFLKVQIFEQMPFNAEKHSLFNHTFFLFPCDTNKKKIHDKKPQPQSQWRWCDTYDWLLSVGINSISMSSFVSTSLSLSITITLSWSTSINPGHLQKEFSQTKE